MLVRHSTKQSLAVPVSLCSVEEPVGAYQAPSGLECATDRFEMVTSVPRAKDSFGDSWSTLSGVVEEALLPLSAVLTVPPISCGDWGIQVA